MCGIIGYTGPLDAKQILCDGLAQLEYRGYDSAGIGLFMKDASVRLLRHTGKVANLAKECEEVKESSCCGLGHTRWATHGGVTKENTHPHRAGRVTLVHNGIIENYHQLTADFNLKEKLCSETDSEVAAWVLDKIYEGNPFEGIRKFVGYLEGSYGFCVMFEDRP